MATVSYTIYSHYDPKDRERLEQETGQYDLEENPEEIWRKEAARMHSKKRPPAAPRFVAAKMAYDAYDSNTTQNSISKVHLEDVEGDSKPVSLFRDIPRTNPAPIRPPVTTSPTPVVAPTPKKPKADKNNWFIMKAIQSEAGSVSAPVTPAPSLADILSREPPPLPSEGRIKPRVWTHIGPSNKGFSMLQRSGWNEGETLGPYAARRAPVEPTLPEVWNDEQPQTRPRSAPSVGDQKVPVKLEDFSDDISEVKHVDVVDLTLTSDSELDGDEDDIEKPVLVPNTPAVEDALGRDVSGHGGRALLTPIATILKADRLGIGLKPKTVAGPSGAYRIPQKRVTPNAAAMAAHIRAAEELRRQKREYGRGHRAFARKKQKEAAERKQMLAYLNS